MVWYLSDKRLTYVIRIFKGENGGGVQSFERSAVGKDNCNGHWLFGKKCNVGHRGRPMLHVDQVTLNLFLFE